MNFQGRITSSKQACFQQRKSRKAKTTEESSGESCTGKYSSKSAGIDFLHKGKMGYFRENSLWVQKRKRVLRVHKTIENQLRSSGINDSSIVVRGSSVTGIRYRTGEPFDTGKRSDIDVGIISFNLHSKFRNMAEQGRFPSIGRIPAAQYHNRSNSTRTGPLQTAEIEALGLGPLQRNLSRELGRPVSFMLFRDARAAARSRPVIMELLNAPSK